MSALPHPLLQILHDAADGRFPPVDGGVTYLPPFADGREAVVAFTGHAVIASRLGAHEFAELANAADVADLAPDGYGAACAPAIQLRMGDGGTIGDFDVTLFARGTGTGSALLPTKRWDDHRRVLFARELRTDVIVHGDERGFFTISNGLAGRREMSIEITDDLHGSGVGRSLIADALAAVPAGTLLFAGVSPGNARSLRSFLAAGFTPIGSEVVITPFTPNTHR